MQRQPRGDNRWSDVLAHRPDEQRAAAAQRFEDHGIDPDRVRAVLADFGQSLCVAATRGDPDWATPHGGPLSVALLAAEVSALAAYLNSRASAVRAKAVDELLDDLSAVTVAAALGVSRQKVYEISRGGGNPTCLEVGQGADHA